MSDKSGAIPTTASLNRNEVWDVRNLLFLTVFSDGRSRVRPRRAGLGVRDPPVGRLASSESHVAYREDLFRGIGWFIVDGGEWILPVYCMATYEVKT